MQKPKSIDHSQALLSFQCSRPHLLKDSIYYLYLLQDAIYLCQSWECQNPKYAVEVNLQNRLYWTFDKDRYLKSFGIEYRNSVKYFSAKEQFLSDFKRMTSPLIMFKEVSDFFQPIKMVAKGGQSKVYTVQDRKTGEILISKCVDKRYLEEDGGAQGLFNEIQLMQQLKHDTIMKIKEVYEGEHTYYMLMDYLKGPSLHEITLKGNLNIDQIRKILLQIVQGVAYLHSKKVMHRDLKPENIMFRDKESVNHVRICDFGLATSVDVPKLPFPKCGTPGYVAPEIANLKDDQKYGLACDMFSVGCIFYRMITSKDLFPGNDYQEILKMNKKCNLQIDNLAMYRLPHSGISLIKQMLAVDPQERITAAQAVHHPFFEGSPTDVKLKFQSQKKKDPHNKLWQTQNFIIKDPPKYDLNNEEDHVEDENITIKVPIPNKARLQHHAHHKNLTLGTIPIPRKDGFKKSQSIEFNISSPESQSPDAQSPGMIISFGHHQVKHSENHNAKHSLFEKYQQNNGIQELEEDK